MKKIIIALCIIAVLAVAFNLGGAPKVRELPQNEEIVQPTVEEVPAAIKTEEIQKTAVEKTKETQKKTEKIEEESTSLTCILSVRCDNAVGKGNIAIPQNGIIFEEQEVAFYEGESVFNVLVREMKKNGIHLEFVNTPIYNSAYIEGIDNLYEFDCGELSGWMYKVNGIYPNYGCSGYEIKDKDKIEWVYTCDLGKDVGGDYSARNGMQYE